MKSFVYRDELNEPEPALKKKPNKKWWYLAGLVLLLGLAGVGSWVMLSANTAAEQTPEAARVLDVQANLSFQILIPSYLPAQFDRAGVEISVSQQALNQEPVTQLAYRAPKGATLFLREWVPVNPQLEVLAGSRPVRTKWGQSWLSAQDKGIGVVWVDTGALRVGIYCDNLDLVSDGQLVQIANSLGPARAPPRAIRTVESGMRNGTALAPDKSSSKKTAGVQEILLVVTGKGYSPATIAVKKGIPVHLTFRQLGFVSCGNQLFFPADPQNPAYLELRSANDKQALQFTPQQVGEFQFHCPHFIYRGTLSVVE